MDAIREYITSNSILALLIVALVYWIGEVIGTATKAWIPSVFVIAILFIAGYWTIFPTDPNIVTVAGLGPPLGGTLVIMLCIGHMGTIINLKQLAEQWKVILIALAGLVGMIVLVWFVVSLWVDRNLVVAALPPLTGGIVAATTMSTTARELGLVSASVMAIAMYIIQGFAGYPLTAVMLKIEGKKLLKSYRAGGGVTETVKIDEEAGNLASEQKAKKKLIPYVNSKYASTAFFIFKLMVAALISFFLSQINIGAIWGGTFKIAGAVWQLIVAIVLTELGFFETDILNKAKSYGFLMFVLMIFVFAGLADATPDMLFSLIVPILSVLLVGVAGMALFAGVVGLLLKVGFPMAVAVACTALYGFPPNVILTEEGVNALAETPEEKDYLMGKMLPMMIVGGFVTVTITSVILAGIFTNMFVV